jgi:hypothetical protein
MEAIKINNVDVITQTEPSSTSWPALGGISIATPSPPAEEEEWHFVPREGALETGMILIGETFNKPQLFRQRSLSAPNLCKLKSQAVVAEDDSTDEDEGAKLPATSVWGSPGSNTKKLPSFLRAEISVETGVIRNDDHPDKDVLTPLTKRYKIKPKFVVAPIRRCTKSTGDLQSLAQVSDEVLGEQDAVEYYAQKSAGHRGRQNGQKLRPDEAKRREIILNKKDLQRQGQSSK